MCQITETIINDCADLQELEGRFREQTQQMEQYAKEGKYVLAENCRVNLEKLKKEIDSKRLTELQKRQKKENRDVKKYLKEELTTFGQEWQHKISSFTQEGAKMLAALKEKHKQERQDAKTKFEEETPEKCKESSECLNLRRIEESMAKQQNYVEAGKVQKLVREMERKEHEAWMKARSEKIEGALELLKIRQELEVKALEKRVESGRCELEVERSKAEGQLALKQSNVSRDIQAQNKKEFLSTKGEFKSRADLLSPSRLLSPTRSRLLSPTRSQLLLNFTR